MITPSWAPQSPVYRPRTLAALTLSLGFLPAALYAQSVVTQLDNVVVTPNRSPQAVGQAIGDVTVVHREELQRASGDSVAEILARQPGVQFTSNGGRQTATGVMLRGANTQHTLVLIDGIRLNSSVQDGATWSALDPAMIERIEILRGAASSLYGSDAIGGVVNIITRKGDGDRPLSAWADLGVGSHQTIKASTGLAGAQEGWDYAFAASMTDSEGHDATTSAVPWGNHNPDRDGYSQHSMTGTLGYRWARGQHLGLNFYNSYIDGDYDAGPATEMAHSLTRLQTYALTSTNEITDYWQSVLRVALGKEAHEDRVWSTRFSSLQRSYNWQNNFKIADGQNASIYVERIEERPAHDAGLETSRRDTNAIGLVYNGHFGRHSVQASLRNDNISNYGNEVTGAVGYDLALTDTWTVGVIGNTGFHAPTFSDLYYPGSENPDLQPELSRNIEAHVRFQKNGLTLSAVAYQNKIKDLLAWDNMTWRMENVDRATIRGATLTAAYEWDNTTLRASADFMRSRDDNTGATLLRRPRQYYSLSGEHRINDLRLGAEYQFQGKRDDMAVDPISFESFRITLGSYSVVNLTASYDFSPHASVQLRWNNVLDKNYATAYGYKTPGSNVFVNLSVRM